jgi:hypothetical protein
MAANEISERLAAAAWVQCGAEDGGEGVAVFDVSQLRFRSYVSFKNRITTTTSPGEVPLLLLELDRVFSRRECAVFAVRHGTVGPTPASRASYPSLGGPAADYSEVFAQPFHMDWLGPDLENPTWYPMGLLPGPQAVPGTFDLDLFNAVAVLLPVTDGVAESGDFSVLLLKHPPIEGDTEVLSVLPVGA